MSHPLFILLSQVNIIYSSLVRNFYVPKPLSKSKNPEKGFKFKFSVNVYTVFLTGRYVATSACVITNTRISNNSSIRAA